MLVTNQTSQDYWFGPLHLDGGVGETLTVDDTSATSLYLTDDSVADSINALYAAGKITVSGAALPFPRPTGMPEVLHGDGAPEGMVYGGQGSIYLRRDNGTVYTKTTGVHFNTGWSELASISGGSGSPSGAIAAFAGSTGPSGWLLCDGSAVSRTSYADLFAAIGTAYGSGDGTTTFNLPDMRGRVAVGYAATGGHTDVSTLGNNDGTALGSRRPRHGHTANEHGPLETGGNTVGLAGSPAVQEVQGQYVTVGPQANAPTDAPAYLVVNYIIKA